MFGMTKPVPEQIAEMANLVADRSIREEGCLAPALDGISEEIRRVQAPFLDVAYDLNRIALAGWMEAENSGEKSDLIPVANRMFLRAINGFGAAVTLTRRGMDIEAQTLARTIYECAFWLGYFEKQPSQALEHFKIENKRSVQAHHILLGKQGLIPEEEAALSQRVYDDLKRVKIPGMEKMAETGDLLEAFPFYKYLCGMAAHSSMASLDRYLDEDVDGKAAHAFDFSGDGLPETLGFAIVGLLAALTKWQALTRVSLNEADLRRIEAEATLMFFEQDVREAAR